MPKCPELGYFGCLQNKGLFEDIVEGMKTAKVVVACVSDQVKYSINFGLFSTIYFQVLLVVVMPSATQFNNIDAVL